MVRNKHLLTPLAFSLPSLGSTDCSVDALTSIVEKIPNASLNFANWVAANGTFGDAAPGTNYFNATSLPALCGLSVNIQTPGDTSYNFGLFLPREWNNRFMAAGNGGWSGGVNWVEMVGLSRPSQS
jgi:feruloyl esterase